MEVQVIHKQQSQTKARSHEGLNGSSTTTMSNNTDNVRGRAQTEYETGYFVNDFETEQAYLQALGPAIDDETSARHMSHLVQVNDEALSGRAGSEKKIAQVFLSSSAVEPTEDHETLEAIFGTVGPAIDDMTTAQYASSYFA